MAENMRLRVVLDLAERALAPLKRITSGSSQAARALNATRERLKALNAQQKTLDGFYAQKAAMGQAANKMRVLQQQLDAMRLSQVASVAQLAAQQKALAAAASAYDKQRDSVFRLRRQLTALGAGALSGLQPKLRADIEAANAAYKKQELHLKRLASLRVRQDKAGQRWGSAVGTGQAMYYSGLHMTQALAHPMAEGKHAATEELRIAALGLGDKATADAIEFAKGLKTYGTSMTENLGLMRDAITVLSDVPHAKLVTPLLAKMKFANEAVFGAEHGAENEARFMDMLKVIELRGGLASQAAFERQANIVQQVLTATGGRVGPSEWLDMIKTGGVAAKGLADKAFYFQMEPLVQEMGGHRVGTAMMSAYQNIYQGKTTKRAAQMLDQLGLIADTSKVKHDKVGQISQLGVGALKGSEIFRHNQFEWMEKVLLPALAQKGITDKQQVLDTLGGIFSNRTASSLFAQMYLQREQVHKNAALNAGADGIDALHGKARGNPTGREIELRKRRDDLYQELSRAVMPAYVAALEAATGAIKGLLNLMRKFPSVSKGLGVLIGGAALLMVALGALLVPLALVTGKLMLLRFVFGRLWLALAGMRAGAASAGMGLLSRMAAGAGRLFAAVLPAAQAVGSALLSLGRFLLATPLGRALSLLAFSATMVWANWQGIKGGLVAIWEGICNRVTEALKGGLGQWAALLADFSPIGILYSVIAFALSTLGLELPERLSTLGASLVSGLVGGITSGLGWLKDTVLGLGASVAQWFAGVLGINSPSRVFMQLGGWVSEGAALGISTGQAGVRNAALGMAAAASLGLGTAGATALRLDSRAALSAPASAPGAMAAGATIHITINAAPGQDPQAIARAVAAELDRRERAGRSRVLSQLTDID